MINKNFLLIFGILLFVIAIANARAGCVGAAYNFVCGSTINESCTMNESVSCNTTAFHIGASNIVIVCNGYTIGFSSSGSGYGINNTDGYDNITIKNCNLNQVAGYSSSHAIYLKNSDNSTIYNCTIRNTKFACSNILLYNSRYTNISKINGSSTGSSSASSIFLSSGSNYNNITDSYLYASSSTDGSPTISISNSHYNLIENNIINNTGAAQYSHGMSISDGSQNNTIRNNYITSSSSDYSHGISIKTSMTKLNTITNNTIIALGRYGGGIALQESTNNNNITNNKVNKTTNYGYGIYLTGVSSNNVQDNLVYTFTSSSKGLYISTSNSDTITNNTIMNNGVYSDDGLGIYLENSNNETLRNNSCYNDRSFSYIIVGSSITHYNNSIDSSNLAEEKPVLYNFSISDLTYENLNLSDYGEILCGWCSNLLYNNITMGRDGMIFINSTNITIKNSYFDSAVGPSIVFMIKTRNSAITNNTMINRGTSNYAVELFNDADNNNVTYNNATAYYYNNLFWLYFNSNNNYIAHNRATFLASAASSGSCYRLYTADNNTLEDNYCDGNSKANGMYIYDSENIIIKDNNLSSYGANIQGIIADQYSHNLTIQNNTIQVNGNPSHGLILKNSWNSKVLNNNITVLNSNSDAIQLNNASNTNITNNFGSSKDWVFNFLGSTSNLTVKNNTLIANGGSAAGGIIAAIYNSTFEDLTINVTSSTSSNYACVHFNGGNNNIFRRITCNGIKTPAVRYGVATNLTFYDSYFYSTHNYYVYFGANGTLNFTNVTFEKSKVYFAAGTTSILNNHYYLDAQVNYTNGTAVQGAYVTGYDNAYNLAFNETTYANGSIDRQTLLEYMQNATSTYYKTNYSINATKGAEHSSSTEQVNLTTNFIFPDSFVQLRFISCGCDNGTYNYSCGQTITESCTMNCNLNATGTCFTIGADNIVIDGNGYSIMGATGTGIYLNSRNNVTIKNFQIYNFSYGIYLLSSSNNTISNNIANYNSYRGIYLFSSSNNALTNNTANNNMLYGINLDYSSNNTITNNTANNNWDGIYLLSSSNNNITNNIVNNHFDGIYLSSSSNNTITNNTANNNSYGINLDYSSNYNTLTNNTANNNSYGIYLESALNNLFKDSIINASITNDIYSSGTSNNTFLNVSFNKSNVQIDDGVIYVKWYVDVLVKDSISNNGIDGATVTFYDDAGSDDEDIITTVTTNSSGYIGRQNITEYMQNSSGKYYDAPIKVKVSASGYNSNYAITYLTTNNVTDDNTHIVLSLSPVGSGGGSGGGSSGTSESDLFIVKINALRDFYYGDNNIVYIETYNYANEKTRVDNLNISIEYNGTNENLTFNSSAFEIIEMQTGRVGEYKYNVLVKDNRTIGERFKLIVNTIKNGKTVSEEHVFLVKEGKIPTITKINQIIEDIKNNKYTNLILIIIGGILFILLLFFVFVLMRKKKVI